MGADHAFPGIGAELQKLHHFGGLGQFGADLFQSLADDETAAIVDLVDLFDIFDGLKNIS